ncbi:hypothetical protein CTI12_AA227060 [Artemisia annua]|uniref:Uncharacterized protein n=1 Tax=Artemisia annua TaxID=35608 RepID=A0A2U1NUT4_ARTAN|nr:hypothetical protein CTI12_AA350830 [Artemisia annua]PWA77244.1 hypothetical protein CTI12_AA227060 [Artemisia annua]
MRDNTCAEIAMDMYLVVNADHWQSMEMKSQTIKAILKELSVIPSQVVRTEKTATDSMDDNLIHMVRTQHLAAIHAVCLVVALIAHHRLKNRNRINVPTRESMLHRQEEKPDAAKLRKQPILHYNELVELFGKDRATGEASETAKERKKRMEQDEQQVETIDEIDQLLETNEISLENFTTGDNAHVTPQVQLTNTLPSKSKKRKFEEDAFTSKIMSSLNNLADAIDRTTKVMERSRPHVYSEVEIYQELELMGVKREDISRAYLFLVGNPEKTRALFGVPLDMRMDILATMMDGNE